MVSGLATRIDRDKRALSHTARTWGSTADDRELSFACDSHLSRHDVALHRAIEVAASAPTVFRWLCQLRVAPYSYDWLDNLGRRSPRRLTPGLDELKLGQRFMWIFTLVEFEPDEHVTLAYRLAPAFGNYAVTYRVVSVETDRCRLVVKLLIAAPRRGPFRPVVRATAPYADLFMMQKQLRTLKQLAEEVGLGRP